MTPIKQTRGKCAYCGRQMTRSGLSRHLEACSARREAIELANKREGRRELLFHLLARDAWGGDYWLHLEVNGTARLSVLDRYLRRIWLECCGHMSQFSVGGWRGSQILKQAPVEDVFDPGVVVTHIYDFGTPSETLIKAVRVRQGRPLTSHPIALMARNAASEFECAQCSSSATSMCLDCDFDEGEVGQFCDQHGEEHEHVHPDGLVELSNSPRLGMCGYSGPAEPPY